MSQPKQTYFLRALRDLGRAFTTSERASSKERYTNLREGHPDWMRGAVFAAHEALGGRLPGDWEYEACREMVLGLVDHAPDDADEAREAVHEVADGAVDIYSSARYAWLADNVRNADLVNEACSDIGVALDADIVTRIGLGQYKAYELIAFALVEACEAEGNARAQAFAERIAEVAEKIGASS